MSGYEEVNFQTRFPLAEVNVSQIILVTITSLSLSFSLEAHPSAIRIVRLFLLLLSFEIGIFVVCVLHPRVAHDTCAPFPPAKRMARTSKLQESLFDSRSDAVHGRVFLSHLVAAASSLRRVRGRQSATAVCKRFTRYRPPRSSSSLARSPREEGGGVLSRFFFRFSYRYLLEREKVDWRSRKETSRVY